MYQKNKLALYIHLEKLNFMKKIISTILVFGIAVATNMLSAQEMTKEQGQAFQTDNIETFKKFFPKEDYNKCFAVKKDSYTLLAYSVLYERKNILNYLISNKVDVNKACNNQTPLSIAEMYDKANMKKILIEKGAKK
jgi:ankyrin repeat protein